MDDLVNWVVPGFVVVLATAAVLRIVPRGRTRTRDGTLWMATLAVLLFPALAHAVSTAAAVVPTDTHLVAPDARAAVREGQHPRAAAWLVAADALKSPLSTVSDGPQTSVAHDLPQPVALRPLTLWAAAASAGVVAGHASQNAAVNTAGVFARLGKRVTKFF